MIAKVRSALEASEQSGVATLVASWTDANIADALRNKGSETAVGTLFLPSKHLCEIGERS